VVSLAPLLENALAADGSLFVVGDPKQSIYSFRGADWTIMTREMQGGSFPSARGRPAAGDELPQQRELCGSSPRSSIASCGHRLCRRAPLSGLDRVVQKVEAKAEDAGYVRVGSFSAAKKGRIRCWRRRWARCGSALRAATGPPRSPSWRRGTTR